jgi:methyl-accepting chemotaxis protein
MFSKLSSSVQYKIAALIALTVLVGSVPNAWYGTQSTTAALTEGATTQLANTAASEKQRIEMELSSIVADLRLLREAPPPQGLIRATDNGGIDPRDGSTRAVWIKRMETIFKSMLKAKPEYLRIRLIDHQGAEAMRVDNKNGTQVVPPRRNVPIRPTPIISLEP